MEPLIALVTLPLLLILPGLVTLWGLLFEQPRELNSPDDFNAGAAAVPRLDLIEAIGLWMMASFLLTSLAAFTLVLLGFFSLPLLTGVVGIYVALVTATTLARSRGRSFSLRCRIGSKEVLIALSAVLMLCLTVLLFSRSSEPILSFRDPAIYVNMGIHIAKSGSSLIEDPLYYSLEEDLQATLIYERPIDAVVDQTGGFQIEHRLRGFPRDVRLNKTTPQFFNLFPTWLAVGYSIFGIPGIFMISPLFGGLSVLLTFLLGRRLFGSPAGMAAAALLAVNLAHFWHAKSPAAEIMYQTAFLTAVLFWVLFSSTRHRIFGVFAAVGFGSLTLIRIDSALILVAILIFFLYLIAVRKIHGSDFFFALPLLAVATLGLVDALYSSQPYVMLLYRLSPGVPEALAGLLILAGVAGLSAGFVGLGLSSMLRRWETKHASRLRVVLAFGLVGVAIFAYFIRPGFEETLSIDLAGNAGRRYIGESLVRLGWYLSPFGIAMATIGCAMAVIRSDNRGLTLFLFISLLVTVYYLFDPRIIPDHFRAIRRFVPITIPMALLFIGLVIQVVGWGHSGTASAPSRGGLLTLLGRQVAAASCLLPIRRVMTQVNRKHLAVGLLGGLLVFSVHQIWSLVFYRDWEGSIAAVEQVAEGFPKEAIIVFDQSTLGHLLAPSLKLIYDLEAFVMGPAGSSESYYSLCDPTSVYPSAQEPQSCILAKLAQVTAPRPFFWVTPGAGEQPRLVRERFEKLDGQSIDIAVPKLEGTTNRLPQRSDARQFRLLGVVYRLDRKTSFDASLHSED